jgi:hypothetical protein
MHAVYKLKWKQALHSWFLRTTHETYVSPEPLQVGLLRLSGNLPGRYTIAAVKHQRYPVQMQL